MDGTCVLTDRQFVWVARLESTEAVLKARLRIFYQKHAPESVLKALETARLFIGREDDLNKVLREAHGADLSAITLAEAAALIDTEAAAAQLEREPEPELEPSALDRTSEDSRVIIEVVSARGLPATNSWGPQSDGTTSSCP
jgi:hypothetical protein